SILPVRSGLLPFRGTLVATVGASGSLALAFAGKAVQTLTAGRYTVRVLDGSKTSGFTMQRAHAGAPTTLTTAAFSGRYARIISIKSGQWLYFWGKGFPHYFFVTA